MNVAQVGAVFSGELNMDITMEASVERFLIFLDLASVSGPVHVSWKYELNTKTRRSNLFSSPLKVAKTSHRQKQPKRSLRKVLLVIRLR